MLTSELARWPHGDLEIWRFMLVLILPRFFEFERCRVDDCFRVCWYVGPDGVAIALVVAAFVNDC